MALPRLLQILFQNEGAGPKLNTEILPNIPAENLPTATDTTVGAVKRGDVVCTSEQTLSTQQKEQAQQNMGGPFLPKDLNSLPEEWLDALFPAGQYLQLDTTTIPYRSLLCNGAVVSRTQYARLFAAIGTKHGAGDGSTTFVLPNADGRVLQGTTDLEQVGQYLEASLPNISGWIGCYGLGQAAENTAWNGALSTISNQGLGLSIVQGTEQWLQQDIFFDSTKASNLFSGSKLQPLALNSLVAIRF